MGQFQLLPGAISRTASRSLKPCPRVPSMLKMYARQIGYRLMKYEMCLQVITTILSVLHGCSLSRDGSTFLVNRGKKRIRLNANHLVYAIDVARDFDTYFSQVEASTIGAWSEVDYSVPRLHRLANGIEFEIPSLPEEAPTLESYFRFYRPKAGDIVFDIGAYCGVFTYELSRHVGASGKVVAFEPDPLNAQILRRNVERHGLKNVVIANVAVSDHNGDAQFNPEGSLGSALSASIDRPSNNTHIMVRTVSFEQACATYGVPNFVKIDAEGAELEIISGAKKFISEHRINFALDTNHIRGGRFTSDAIESLFGDICYVAESSADAGASITTWGRPRSSTREG